MGRYKQKINEKPSIDTKGFVGVIANKSNITIDNSYIEKGTALINAFENSNVILKNCGTPVPTSESDENIVNKAISKLTNEIDRKTLPFFIHHKIARFDDENLNVNDNNPTLSRLEIINEYDTNNDEYRQINEFRQNIGSNLKNDEERNQPICDSKFLLEQQILRSKDLLTKDINFTISGLYYLSGLTSSIKAVFPLNASLKTNFDNPKLNLNYVNREIFPYQINGQNVRIKNVNKLDSFGNEIDIPGSDTISIAPITRKYIVASSLNKPISTNSSVYLNTSDGKPILKFNNYENSNYFENGPYLNNTAYISYYKNDKTTKGKLLVNDVHGKETDFYFKIYITDDSEPETFSLREIINNKRQYENSNDSTISGYVWKYYLGSGKKIKSEDGFIVLDSFSENTFKYQPEQKPEICNFYGFSFENLNSSWNSDNTNYDFYDNENTNITSDIFGIDFNSIPTLFKTCWIDYNKKNTISLSNEYENKKYYLMTNNGTFDIDNNIKSDIEIVSEFTGNAKCDIDTNLFDPSTSVGSSLYFPLEYGTISGNGMTSSDFYDSENYKLIQNYKLIININEAISGKLMDPASGSISFTLNIPTNVVKPQVGVRLKEKRAELVTKWQCKQIDNSNGNNNGNGNDNNISYQYKAITNFSSSVIEDYYEVNSSLDNSFRIINCRNALSFEDSKNIIRENDKGENTLKSFLATCYSGVKYFQIEKNAYNDDMNIAISSLFSSRSYIKDTGNSNETKYLITYSRSNANAKLYNGGTCYYDNNCPSPSSYTYDSSTAPSVNFASTNFVDIDTSNVPDAIKRSLSNNLKTYYIIDPEQENDNFNNFKTYYTELYPDVSSFFSNIVGYFSDNKQEHPVSLPESCVNGLTGERKSNLDKKRASQYFRDMMNEAKIGSNINAYSNVSGNFVNLLNDLFKNGKISDIKCISGENPMNSICSTSTSELTSDDITVSGLFMSKESYNTGSKQLENDWIEKAKLNIESKFKNSNSEQNKVKIELENDFNFEIIDVNYDINSSNYAYFGFILHYNHEAQLNKSYNESNIILSKEENTTKKQTIKFLHYTSGDFLPLPSRYTGSIYDYANSISGLYLIKDNKDSREITTIDEIKDEKQEIMESYLEFVPLNDPNNGLPALSSNYNGIYFNGNDTITFSNDDYLLIDDESGNIYAKNVDRTLTGGIFVNPGVKLTTSILSGNIPNMFELKYNGDQLVELAQNIKLKIQTIDPLKLYFDEGCKIPMEYDADTNELYDHTSNGIKIYNENNVEKTEGSKITKHSYKKLCEFEYETTTIKELASFNDWYNVDTYINYYNIDNNEKIKKFNLSIEGNYTKNISSYFVDNSFKLTSSNDMSYLKLTSTNEDVSIPIVAESSNKTEIYGFDNNFKSIFNNRPAKFEKYQGYKLFSFNFKIPSEGWGQFDEEMYQENPNWKKDITSNTSDDYLDIIPSISDLKNKSINGLSSTFEGEFIAGYSIFNRRYEYDSTAIKFKTHKLKLIPLYMGTKDGDMCDTKTGVVSGYNLSNLPSSRRNNLDIVGYYNVPELNNNSTVTGAITMNNISYPVYSSKSFGNNNTCPAQWINGNGQRISIYSRSRQWESLSGKFKNEVTTNDITDNANGITTNDSYVSGNFKPSDLIDVLGLDSYSYYSTSFHWTANIKTISSSEGKRLNLTSNNDTLAFSLNLKKITSNKDSDIIYEGVHNLQGFIFSINVKQNGKTEARNVIIPSLEIYAKYNETKNELYLSVDSYESSESFDLFSESSDGTYLAIKNYKINDVAQLGEKYYECTKAVNNASNWTKHGKTTIDIFSLDKDYYLGDVFYFKSKYYQCTANHTSIWRKIENVEAFELMSNYDKGDVVSHDNKYYYCTKSITSKWNKISSNDYSIANTYKYDDVAKYDGEFYKCGSAQTPYWSKLSFEEFKTGRNYLKGTIVIYNDEFYYNKTPITNATKWEKNKWGKIDHYLLSKAYAVNNYMFYDGVPYKCSKKTKAFWQKIKITAKFSEKSRYNVNYCVLYDGVPYICKEQVKTPGKFSSSNWKKVIDYSMIKDYVKNDVVKFNGEYFKCTSPITLGWKIVEDFVITKKYATNAIVFYNGDIIKSNAEISDNYKYFNASSDWAIISKFELDATTDKSPAINTVYEYEGNFYESMGTGTTIHPTKYSTEIKDAPYDSGKTYECGTIISYNGELYECEKTGSKIELSLSDWREIETYSSSKSYSKGSLIVKDNTVYRAVTSISANSTWNGKNWKTIISNIYDVNKDLVYDSNNLISKSSQFYLDLKRQNGGNDFNEINLSNIASIKNQNELGYPLEWMTIGQIGFSTSPVFEDKIHKIGIKGTSKNFSGKMSDENDKTKRSVYDIERFVKPFDMSTNLFYYKASIDEETRDKDVIAADDEVIIINARKMYNQVPDEVEKPEGGSLDFRLGSLHNKEFILTGYIPLTGSTSPFEEQYLYRNENYEYIISGNEIGNDLPADESPYKETWHECRYTDYLNTADQWKLYKLNNKIIFSTTNDFSTKLYPKTSVVLTSDGNKLNDQEERNSIDIPCKISMTFDNLFFKEKIRTGVSFDNVSDLSFSSRIFPNSMIGNISKNELSSRWELTKIGSAESSISGMILSEDTNELIVNSSQDSYGYLCDYYIDSKTPSSLLFGGSEYYNDVMNMNVTSNSVNRWSTSYVSHKYEKLKVLSDYCPQKDNGKLVGTPYCNLLSTLFVKEIVYQGTSSGDDGIVAGDFIELGGVVDIAKDFKYINNVRYSSSFDDIEDYPSNNDLIEIISSNWENTSAPSSYGKNTYIKKYMLAGKLVNLYVTGKKKFDIGNNSFYVYFDGLLYEKEVAINDNSESIEFGTTKYNIISIIESTVSVENDGSFEGYIAFELCQTSNLEKDKIEIHNVKMPCPCVNSIGISYNKDYLHLLDENGYLTIDDEVWQKKVFLENLNTNLKKIVQEDLIFTLQEDNELRSSIEIDYDNYGKPVGIFVSLTFPGLNKFAGCETKFFLENAYETEIKNNDMLNQYKDLAQFNLDKYKSNAVIGDTILTGAINFEYNKLITSKLDSSFNNIGNLKYVYNPIGKNDFQLEVIIKSKNSDKFEKDLYYINKPVDKWYNLGIYRWDKDNVNTNGEYERTSKIGFMLNELNSNKINEISSSGNEIFNCTVTNDLIIDGINVDSSVSGVTDFETILGLTDSGTTSMYNYKTLMTVQFDPCSRAPWNTWQTTDMSNLINSNIITELDYENRRGKDLYSVSEFSFDKISTISGMFTNEFEVIKIFANDELDHILNTGIKDTLVDNIASNLISSNDQNIDGTPYFINYASLINNEVNTEYSSLNSRLNSINNVTKTDVTGIRNYLNRYIPRRIMLNDSANNYVLDLKDTKYHISPVKGIEAKNIMFVSSPNLSIYSNEDSYVHYVENYNDSLKMVNDYIDYFNNPQHRLPAVEYDNHILSSDFATFIYNSCNKFKAINVDQVDKQLEVLNFNYDNVPSKIANVWDNSQVTRNETVFNGSLNDSKLYWTKSSNEEFITEVGSLYNYQNSTYMTNIVKIETGSINERQTILMPVLSEPFEFEQRSAESGIIKVTDQIIATAALGYNSTGYPINSILQYNSNGSVSIDTRQTQYLYVSQQDSYNDCYFGATAQKPVYVDAIQQNTQSLSEKFTFLPNPSISNELTGQDVDPFLIQYYGGNLGEFDATDSDEKLFLLPFVKNNGYYYPSIDETVIKDICYSCANNLKEHSVYSYATNDISGVTLDNTGTILNYTNNNSVGKYVTFIGNLLSFKIKSDVSIKKESLNVFFNEKDFDKMVQDLGGIDIESSFETMNCYGYDGLLIPSSLWYNSISGFADDPEMVDGNYNEIKTKLDNYSGLFKYSDEVDMEPTIGIIWKNIDTIENYANYNKIVNANIGDNPNNRHAIFDEYYSTNITGFKLKIKNEHLSSAPIYIKVSLLKVVKDASGGGKFAWWNDPILDLNLTDSYENIYDYSNVSDKEIEKMFINYPDKTELIKHSYGIKFTVKQIVPQQKQNNKCIIDNIEIYTSNILNKYGIGVSVEDTFVRKADANCRNSYQMNVNEYVWRMPKNKAEWRNVYDVISDDANSGNYNLIDEDSYKVISGLLSDMTKPNNLAINSQIQNGSNFSYMSTYYFTNSNVSSNKITEVLSDNYLVNSNIKISWKYIDYVYISYECYSPNSMDLLNAYFGKKIYNAVKAKLLANIDNMNSNSAFKDRYKFTGGIAKSKNENINTKTTNAAFKWKNSISKDQWNTYRNCYTKSGTTSESYATEVWKDSNYTDMYVNGVLTQSTLNWSKTYEGDTVKLSDKGASQSLESVKREHIGQTTVTESSTVLENTKYSSAEEWTKTFMPIAIKFKIN